MSAIPEPLREARYICLETFKKDGSGVRTPVWAARVEEALYVTTPSSSWKARRLERDPHARLAACNGSGSKILSAWSDASGTALEPGSEGTRAVAALKAKYGLQYRLFAFFARVRGQSGEQVVLRFQVA